MSTFDYGCVPTRARSRRPEGAFQFPGRQRCLSDRVPEGLLTIARRFNAGDLLIMTRVPKGRLKMGINRPFGTWLDCFFYPAVNCRAIFNGSFGTSRPAG